MSVKVTIQEVDGVSVVGLNGRMVLGEESGVLLEAVKITRLLTISKSSIREQRPSRASSKAMRQRQ